MSSIYKSFIYLKNNLLGPTNRNCTTESSCFSERENYKVAKLSTKIMMSLFVLTFLFMNGEVFAQQNRLNADLAMPNLEVENGAKAFKVRINKTTADFTGSLVLNVPAGFKYVAESAKLGGVDLTDGAVVDGNGITLPIEVLASGSDYVEVTYELEALCPSLDLPANDRVVTYELRDIAAPEALPEIKKSNVINLEAAVLNLTVSPSIAIGLVGDELVRTITVRNPGSGGIKNAQISVDYGAGISRVDNEGSLPTGLKYSTTGTGYVYENNLLSGGSFTFTETVKITSCADLTSNYKAFYGEDCNGGGTGTLNTAETIVQIDDTKKPNVVIIDESADAIVCMGGSFAHTWLVKNTGNAPASAISLVIGASTIEGPVLITGGDGSVDVETVSIPVLAPGEERKITFTQKYTVPTPGGDCSDLPTQYRTESTSYTLDYVHAEGCDKGQTPKYTSTGTTKGSLSFAFAGDNVGEAYIQGGQPYQADFKIGTWSFPEGGLSPGAYLEIAIELSADLAKSDLSSAVLFNGASEVGVSVTKDGDIYKIKVLRDALISGSEGNWRLKFPLVLSCQMTGGDPFYKITSTLHNCASSITFACETVELKGHCPEPGDCPQGGMRSGEMGFQRIILGLVDTNNDGQPDGNTDVTSNDLGESIRSFVAGDIVEVS